MNHNKTILAILLVIVITGTASISYVYAISLIPIATVSDTINLELEGPADITILTIDNKHYALVASFTDRGFQIINVTDPTMPVLGKSLGANATTYLAGASGLTTLTIGDKHYALVTAYHTLANAMQIINMTNPGMPERGKIVIHDGTNLLLEGPRDVTTLTIGTKHYALVVSDRSDAMQIIDVTDPDAPVAGTSISHNAGGNTLLDGPRGIDTLTIGDKHYALVVSSVSDAMQIINVTDITAVPVPVASITNTDSNTPFNDPYDVTTLTIDNKHYALIATFSGNAMRIVNVTDVTNPVAIGSVVTSPGLSIAFPYGIDTLTFGGKHYALLAARESGMHLIDVTYPADPILVASIGKNQAKVNGAQGVVALTVDNKPYALVAANNDNALQIIELNMPPPEYPPPPTTRLNVIDPILVTAIFDSTQSARTNFEALAGASGITTVTIKDKPYALVAAYTDDAIQIINMTYPTLPTRVSTITDTADTALNGTQNIATLTVGDQVYAMVTAADDDGVQIIDITDPANPILGMAILDTAGMTEDDIALGGAFGITTLTVKGTPYALVTAYDDDAVQVIDMTDPSNPTHVVAIRDTGDTELNGATGIVTLSIDEKHYALVTGAIDNGVQVINMTKPEMPTHVTKITSVGATPIVGSYGITTVTIDEKHYALVVSDITQNSGINNHVLIFDMTNPAMPDHITVINDGMGDFTELEGARNITTVTIGDKHYALIAASVDNAISIIDITNPAVPTLVTAITDTENTALDSVYGITTLTVDDQLYALAAAADDNGMQVIHLASLGTSSIGGSNCEGDCTYPTIGLDQNNRRIVTDGFTYNGYSINVVHFHTPFPLINATVGDANTVTIKAWDNLGAENIQLVQFGLGLPEISSPISNAEVIIEAWLEPLSINVTDIMITDPHNLIDDESVSVDTRMVSCGGVNELCLELSMLHMYRESPIHDILQVDVMDSSRHVQSTTFNDGINVLGDSMNPPDTLYITEIPKHHPHKVGLMELVSIDRESKLWNDPYEFVWYGDESKVTLLSDVPFKRFEDSTSIFSGHNDRMNSNFNEYKLQQIEKAQKMFDNIMGN